MAQEAAAVQARPKSTGPARAGRAVVQVPALGRDPVPAPGSRRPRPRRGPGARGSDGQEAFGTSGWISATGYKALYWPVVVGVFLPVCVALHVVSHSIARRVRLSLPCIQGAARFRLSEMRGRTNTKRKGEGHGHRQGGRAQGHCNGQGR